MYPYVIHNEIENHFAEFKKDGDSKHLKEIYNKFESINWEFEPYSFSYNLQRRILKWMLKNYAEEPLNDG